MRRLILTLCILALSCTKSTEPTPDTGKPAKPYWGVWRSTESMPGAGQKLGYVKDQLYAIYPDETYAAGVEIIPDVSRLVTPDGIPFPDTVKAIIRTEYYMALTWEGTYRERSNNILQFYIGSVQHISGRWNLPSHIKYSEAWEYEEDRLTFTDMGEAGVFDGKKTTYRLTFPGEDIPLLRVMKNTPETSHLSSEVTGVRGPIEPYSVYFLPNMQFETW